MSDNSHLIESFVAVTNASKYLAEQYLERNGNDLTGAIEDFYSTNGDAGSGNIPRSGSATPKPKATRSGGIRTLKDLGDDDEQPDDKTDANFFTGGEKSALQVENPDKKKKKAEPSLVERIFQRASEQMNEEDDRPSASSSVEEPEHKFTGTGFRLGDSTTPSLAFDTKKAHAISRPVKVNREITFWRQGFTVGEGELRRYDDPENVSLLQELKQGRVPVSLLDVEFGQDVDVSVVRKVDEDYAPPKRKVSGFHGQGHRLGSPVPGEDISAASPVVPESTTSASVNVPENKPEDKGEGDSLVQIRFANGKRVSHKFNGSDPVSVVYAYVRDHAFCDQQKQFTLSHAFPVKPIDDSAEATVESAKLKNAVIMQRWK